MTQFFAEKDFNSEALEFVPKEKRAVLAQEMDKILKSKTGKHTETMWNEFVDGHQMAQVIAANPVASDSRLAQLELRIAQLESGVKLPPEKHAAMVHPDAGKEVNEFEALDNADHNGKHPKDKTRGSSARI